MGRRRSRGTAASGRAGNPVFSRSAFAWLATGTAGPLFGGRCVPSPRPLPYVLVPVLAFALATAPAAPGAEAWPAAAVPASAADAADEGDRSADGLATLYYQLQLLQDDVRRLQGVVEEQNHRIERLVRDQRERYVELDRRLVELARSGAAAPASPASAGAVPRLTGAAPAAGAERAAYNAAFALVQGASRLVRSERAEAYAEALAGFQALVDRYPVGEFTPNAYYWSGEIHLYNATAQPSGECPAAPGSAGAAGCDVSASERLELARQAFVQVATLFPNNAKLPDALYKLGVVYHRLGDRERALEYLDRVVAEHPGHTAADLARNYAAELRG